MKRKRIVVSTSCCGSNAQLLSRRQLFVLAYSSALKMWLIVVLRITKNSNGNSPSTFAFLEFSFFCF